MKYIVNTGSVEAALCFFDVATLPVNFDEQAAKQPLELLEQLQAQQKFCLINTEDEDSYLFHVYVDEQLPSTWFEKAKVIARFDQFAVPSGQLCICGAEYAAKNPLTGGLAKYTDMGDIILLPAGYYQITLLATNWTEQDEAVAQLSVVPEQILRRHHLLEMIIIILGNIGFLVLFFTVIYSITFIVKRIYRLIVQHNDFCVDCLIESTKFWFLPFALGGSLAFVSALLLARLPNYMAINQLLKTVALPDYVLVVETSDDHDKK